MGWATGIAYGKSEGLLGSINERQMRAGICVRDTGHNLFSWNSPAAASFTFDKSHPQYGKHVEDQLFSEVEKRYGGRGQSLPNNAIVVLYCPWSPCPLCTTRTGEFVRGVNARKKSIQVKMLFEKYYTVDERKKGGYKSQKGAWDTQAVADRAYQELIDEFGDVALPSFSKGGVKTRKVLVVQSLDPTKLKQGEPPADRAVPQ